MSNDLNNEAPARGRVTAWFSEWMPELLILALAIGLRFWDFGAAEFNRFADRDAYRAWQMIQGEHFFIGGPEAAFGGNLPGPFLYLGIGLVLLLAGGDPRALVAAAGLTNLVAVVLSYLGMRTLWGRRVAQLGTLHLALLPSHWLNARLAWHPTFGMPLAAGVFLALALVWARGANSRRIIAAGLLCGLATQCHASFLNLLVPGLITCVWHSRERTKHTLLLLGFALLPNLPFVIAQATGQLPQRMDSFGKHRYLLSAISEAPTSPMDAVAQDSYLADEEFFDQAGDPPPINLSPLRIATQQIAPSANERFHDFRWLTRADGMLNFDPWGPFWRFLQTIVFIFLFAAAAFGAHELWRGRDGKDRTAFLASWILCPVLPLLFLFHVCFQNIDGSFAWVSGARYQLPVFPAFSALVALGLQRFLTTQRLARAAIAGIALSIICGTLIQAAFCFVDSYTQRAGFLNQLMLRDKIALARTLRCELGLTMSDVHTRVVDRSLLAAEDDFILPLVYAGRTCAGDTTHRGIGGEACLVLDLPESQWSESFYWPMRMANETIEGATALTASDLTPILQGESFTISIYERSPCLSGNVVNGYFSDARNPARPDGSWGRDL